jgi:hypothetical protein
VISAQKATIGKLVNLDIGGNEISVYSLSKLVELGNSNREARANFVGNRIRLGVALELSSESSG